MTYFYFEYEREGTKFNHKIKLDAWNDIKKEYGTLREYLKTFIHGKFKIIDHYITKD